MANTADDENNMANLLKEGSDIENGLIQLFKDEYREGKKKHDTDLRSRLNKKEVRGLSVISFLQNIINDEASSNKIKIKKQLSLADGLEDLATALKRHKISLDGKSREEVVKLFQNDLENKKSMGFGSKIGNMFRPQA